MTMNIEIFEVALTKNICTVAYCLQDEQGTADVPKYQIPTKNLIEFIERTELANEFPAFDYLNNNTFEVVEQYLMDGLK